MIYKSLPVNAACFLGICVLYLVVPPFYAMWIGGGWIADRRERARLER